MNVKYISLFKKSLFQKTCITVTYTINKVLVKRPSDRTMSTLVEVANVIISICKPDELFRSQMSFVAMAVDKPIDMIGVVIRVYKSYPISDENNKIIEQLEKYIQ